MKVASCATRSYQDPAKNFELIKKYVKEAADQGAKLINIPEGTLHGYPSAFSMADLDELHRIHDNAEVCDGPNKGEYINKVIDLAKEYDIYIVTGVTERNKDYYDIIYNSLILVGPEGYIGRYRKVQPNDELGVYYKGEEYSVFDTAIGKIGLMICYDLDFPEPAREMTLMGAEIICCGVQWPYYDPETADHETDLAYRMYDFFNKARACENGVFVVTSNAFTAEGATSFGFGHARIMDPQGYVLADTAEGEEGICVAELGDVKKKISYARNMGFWTLNMIKDIRPSAYKVIRSGIKYGEYDPKQFED
ncbi:carbon-nitrogen hydrolase family protein [uncultured Pseudoramibacter sp.]|uniref:carbon-nitrogen hydrolase family protein n=1 Tax=uncultured Pseudoramibacter sp. TaxID=1623493 RepID=UPI0025E8B52E|nr:carbon-nitrogen hydrolase family protein [uncultured Pseudoramibacter sp.]